MITDALIYIFWAMFNGFAVALPAAPANLLDSGMMADFKSFFFRANFFVPITEAWDLLPWFFGGVGVIIIIRIARVFTPGG